MTWEDVVAMNRPTVPRPPTAPKPELCGDICYVGDDAMSCEKPKGHDDPMNEVGSGRYDPIHQETLGHDPVVVVTWYYR